MIAFERLTFGGAFAFTAVPVSTPLFAEDEAQSMLQWPHSGFQVHDAVWVDEDDRAVATRRAR